MQKSEYKTVTLDLNPNVQAKGNADLEAVLNHHAAEGWRLVQILELAGGWGDPGKFVLVMERPVSCT